MSAPLHIKMATTGTKVLKNFRPHETEPHGNNEIMDKKGQLSCIVWCYFLYLQKHLLSHSFDSMS